MGEIVHTGPKQEPVFLLWSNGGLAVLFPLHGSKVHTAAVGAGLADRK